jgi:hypothetical protein
MFAAQRASAAAVMTGSAANTGLLQPTSPAEAGAEPSAYQAVVQAVAVDGGSGTGESVAMAKPPPRRKRERPEQNQHLLPKGALDEWQAAIEEYEARHGPKGSPQYPLGTVALYGPDDKTTTKIAAGVILRDGAEPILKRWVATDVMTSPKVQQELQDFFRRHGVKQVAMTEGNLGCPHEEGEDFPLGEDCPFCPFWMGKQGSGRTD